MKAARLYGAKDVRIEDIELRDVGDNEVKIMIAWCGICGSDKHAYLSKDAPMPLPFTPGHEFSGRVVETGAGVKHIRTGERVVVNPIITCGECDSCRRGYPNLCKNIILFGYHGDFGGFAEYTIVNEKMVIPIPDSMPLDLAAIVEPTAIALHGLRISRFKAGDSAVVFGAGAIGLLMTNLLKAAGARSIYVVAHTEYRRQLAKKMGATLVIDPDHEDTCEVITAEEPNGVDYVFDLAGVQQTFSLGLDLIRCRGEFVFIALPGRPLSFDIMPALSKEVVISTAQCTNNEFPMAVSLINDKRIDTDGIITSRISLDNIVNDGFETMIKDKTQIKIIVTPTLKTMN